MTAGSINHQSSNLNEINSPDAIGSSDPQERRTMEHNFENNLQNFIERADNLFSELKKLQSSFQPSETRQRSANFSYSHRSTLQDSQPQNLTHPSSPNQQESQDVRQNLYPLPQFHRRICIIPKRDRNGSCSSAKNKPAKRRVREPSSDRSNFSPSAPPFSSPHNPNS